MTPDQFNLELPERDRILETFEATEGPWLKRIREVAHEIARVDGYVSSDDLRRAMDERPGLRPDRPSLNIMGAVFRAGFVRVSWTHSRVPGSHGNRIGLYYSTRYPRRGERPQ